MKHSKVLLKGKEGKGEGLIEKISVPGHCDIIQITKFTFYSLLLPAIKQLKHVNGRIENVQNKNKKT